MKPKTILFFTGLATLLLGALPLLKCIPQVNNIIQAMPAAGSTAYQTIIVLVGVVAIYFSLKKKPVVVQQR